MKAIKFSIFLSGSIYLLLLIGEAGAQPKTQSTRTTNILPAPQKVELKAGVSVKPESIKTIYLYSQAEDDDQFAAHLLQDKIKELFDYKINLQKTDNYKDLSHSAIVLGIPSTDTNFYNFTSGLNIPSPKNNIKESYVLNVDKDRIIISGSGKTGLFYGIQTLIQLLEDAKWEDTPVDGLLIQDWPDLQIRSVHFDVKHHLDRYEYLKKVIAKLASYKVNEVVFEFENKFGYQSHPDIVAPNSFTPEQVKELTQYAHNYHIDITPLVQGLGHATYILKYDKYKPLRASQERIWAFNPLKEGTYNLLFDLYGEAIKATPGSAYFHIGGDEVGFTGNNSKMKAYKKNHGEFSLYLRWLNKVHNYLEKHDRTIRFWDDVPLKEAGVWQLMRQNDIPEQKADSIWNYGVTKLESVIDQFPQDAVYTQWTYSRATKYNARLIDWFKQHNLQTISATAIQNGPQPLIPNYDQKPANIRSFITLSARKHVLGEFCTAWDDRGLHFETFWMGFLASVEYGWSGSNNPVSVDGYWYKYIRRFFGPHTTGLKDAFHNLSDRVEFWDNALFEKGSKHSANGKTDQLIKLPEVQNINKEEESHLQVLAQKAKQEKERSNQALKTLEKNIDRVTHNAYNLKVFASVGRFMKAHAYFVIAIGRIAQYRDEFKVADNENKKSKAVTYLNKMAATADSAWNQYKKSYQHLKEVWEVSRYPKGGKGFVLNPDGDFPSKTKDLSYLIMVEKELDLPGYAEGLRKKVDIYKKQGSL